MVRGLTIVLLWCYYGVVMVRSCGSILRFDPAVRSCCRNKGELRRVTAMVGPTLGQIPWWGVAKGLLAPEGLVKTPVSRFVDAMVGDEGGGGAWWWWWWWWW